jgi:hypothetical protein
MLIGGEWSFQAKIPHLTKNKYAFLPRLFVSARRVFTMKMFYFRLDIYLDSIVKTEC